MFSVRQEKRAAMSLFSALRIQRRYRGRISSRGRHAVYNAGAAIQDDILAAPGNSGAGIGEARQSLRSAAGYIQLLQASRRHKSDELAIGRPLRVQTNAIGARQFAHLQRIHQTEQETIAAVRAARAQNRVSTIRRWRERVECGLGRGKDLKGHRERYGRRFSKMDEAERGR